MSKHGLKPDFYGQKKKFRTSTINLPASSVSTNNETLHVNQESPVPNDTESAIRYLKSIFPAEKFLGKLPPAVFVHQIYSFVKSKTKVDIDVNCLQTKGVIRLFKLGGEESAHVLISTVDFVNHVEKCCPEKSIIDRFVKNLLPNVNDVGVDKDVLLDEYRYTEQHISDLLSAGLLTLRTESSYWFSFPNAGEFMKSYLRGRRCILRILQKSKYNEILESALKLRNLEKTAKLGVEYHIHDIIGAELVKCVNTTSGTLLRLEKKDGNGPRKYKPTSSTAESSSTN